jgi:hypothetical protein
VWSDSFAFFQERITTPGLGRQPKYSHIINLEKMAANSSTLHLHLTRTRGACHASL